MICVERGAGLGDGHRSNTNNSKYVASKCGK